MLPHSNDPPACGAESLADAAVALRNSRELRKPVASVYGRRRAVLSAGMPETAVDEYRHPLPREDYVRADRNSCREDRMTDTKPVPATVKDSPKPDLRLSISRSVRPHGRRHSRGRWTWVRDSACHAEPPAKCFT